MEYAFDSSQNIQDDILQKELAHTSDEKMKSIISTIQKEQNQIIRDEKADTLIIQGVAGSGKTSIALHRVAFLLYRFRNTIKAQNVTIISPNKVFGDYIAGVLPRAGGGTHLRRQPGGPGPHPAGGGGGLRGRPGPPGDQRQGLAGPGAVQGHGGVRGAYGRLHRPAGGDRLCSQRLPVRGVETCPGSGSGSASRCTSVSP